jgi:hypothetical protein
LSSFAGDLQKPISLLLTTQCPFPKDVRSRFLSPLPAGRPRPDHPHPLLHIKMTFSSTPHYCWPSSKASPPRDRDCQHVDWKQDVILGSSFLCKRLRKS